MTTLITENNKLSPRQRQRGNPRHYMRSHSENMDGFGVYQNKAATEDNIMNNNFYNAYKRSQPICMVNDGVRLNLKMYLKTGGICENLLRNREAEYLDFASHTKDQQLLTLIENFLIGRVTPSCCVDMFQMAVTYDLCQLKEVALRTICGHFEQVSQCPEIQYLGQKIIEELVESPRIRDHPLASKALEHWYVYEKEPRQDYFQKILRFLHKNKERVSPPTFSADEDLVYNAFFQGNKFNRIMSVTLFNINNKTQKTVPLREITDADKGFAVCCQQIDAEDAPYVLISGGSLAPKTVYSCDVVQNVHRKCSSKLVNARAYHCMHAIQNRLFVLGGVYHGQVVGAIEEKKTQQCRRPRVCHSWKEISQLPVPVYKAASCVYKNKIFIVGGLDNSGNPRKCIQKFDPESYRTTLEIELPFSVSSSKALVFNEEIYIITKNLKTVIYNPETQQLRLLDSVPFVRGKIHLFSDGKEVYAAGGHSKSNIEYQTYCLVRNKNTWQQTTVRLEQGLRSSGSCQITIPAKYHSMVPFLS